MTKHDDQATEDRNKRVPADGDTTVYLPNGRPVVVHLTTRKRTALLDQLKQGAITLDPPGDDAA